MASELKLCPFCHKTSHLKIDPFYEPSFDGYYGFNVVCSAAGFDNTDRGCGAAGAWGETEEDAATRWNTRPAPAATDTGLVTVAWRFRDLWEGGHKYWKFTERRYDLEETEFRALCDRSQAEELLAAERARKEMLAESLHIQIKRVNELEADNAAKDAEREAIMQAITDPENQPSKFGTVTIAFFNEKIAAKNARAKTLEQVNAKLCDDVIDYELKIAERDVSLNELKQKLADKFSFTSDDDALAVLERYGHNETGNGIIKADMRSLDDMCRAAVAYLCAEWDFVFQDTVELNREALEAKLAAAEKALEPFANELSERHDKSFRLEPAPDSECVGFTQLTYGHFRKARAVLGGKPSC